MQSRIAEDRRQFFHSQSRGTFFTSTQTERIFPLVTVSRAVAIEYKMVPDRRRVSRFVHRLRSSDMSSVNQVRDRVSPEPKITNTERTHRERSLLASHCRICAGARRPEAQSGSCHWKCDAPPEWGVRAARQNALPRKSVSLKPERKKFELRGNMYISIGAISP
jgi:hypothetical protein